jgi:hypothetical protein
METILLAMLGLISIASSLLDYECSSKIAKVYTARFKPQSKLATKFHNLVYPLFVMYIPTKSTFMLFINIEHEVYAPNS